MRQINCSFVAFVLFIATCIGHTLGDVGHSRDKRSVLRLGEMIGCTTEKNIMQVLSTYNGYGCWCGLGGKGAPKDAIDACCHVHDQCYDTALANKDCKHDEVYVVEYKKTCKNKKASCSSKPGTCAEVICECDAAVAECMAANQKIYNKKYRNYKRDKYCKK